MEDSAKFFKRRYVAETNDLKRSLGALMGIAQGLVCDDYLNDAEINFLDQWIAANDAIAWSWPGDVIHARVRAALSAGRVTEEDRTHLFQTLQQLIGGPADEIANSTHVTELAFDDVARVEFQGQRFCVTGEFVYGPRESCATAIQQRGGIVADSITKKLRYLVIGTLGSFEWKHGSFGTKIEKAIQYKREGIPILIVREDQWASSL